MAKRLTACLAALVLALTMPVTAFAAGGFFETGGHTDTDPKYTMNTDEAVQVYNKQLIEDPNYTDIYSGSALYVPIYVIDDDKGTERIATAKQIKDNKIEVSYKVTRGERYITNVSIIDGKKDKITGLPGGAYVKIEFTDNMTSSSSMLVEAKLVLSVNGVSYQDSRVTLECEVANRMEYINDDSVYGAKVTTRFRVDNWYKGEATFDMGDGVLYTARVSTDGRYTIDFSTDPDYDIDLMYPNAYLEFYNFRGNNDTFASVGELKIPVNTAKFKDPGSNQPRVYAYEVLAGNQLRALGSDVASYDGQKKVLTIRTQTLGHYVLSNVKLFQSVEAGDDQTFQYGYATREAVTEAATETTGTSATTASGASSAAAATPAPVAVSDETLNPVTGPAADTPAAAAVADTAEEPRVANVRLIYANNPPGDNPSTGPVLGLMPVLLLGGVTAAALWKNRSAFRKR